MAYALIPGYSGHTSGTQTAVNRIVIHATVSPCVKGGARNVAKYFQSADAGGSAHYVVDPGEIIRCYAETTVTWHAPPNTGSIGIELCDPQKGTAARWADADHEAMLRLAAKLVREVAARWNVPLKRLSVADLKAGKRGICGHVDVANAWHKTDHGDPDIAGPFPWTHFMQLVTQEELDMDANEVFAAVWTKDKVPAPDGSKTNPTWQPQSFLVDTNKRLRTVESDLAQVKALLGEVLAKLGEPPA